MEAGGRSAPVDLEAFYPTLREEGPGYARRRFTSDPQRVARKAAEKGLIPADAVDSAALHLSTLNVAEDPGTSERAASPER